MAISTRTGARQRVDDVRIFREELARVEAEGALRPADDQHGAPGGR